jgi:hypothetical protein
VIKSTQTEVDQQIHWTPQWPEQFRSCCETAKEVTTMAKPFWCELHISATVRGATLQLGVSHTVLVSHTGSHSDVTSPCV